MVIVIQAGLLTRPPGRIGTRWKNEYLASHRSLDLVGYSAKAGLPGSC